MAKYVLIEKEIWNGFNLFLYKYWPSHIIRVPITTYNGVVKCFYTVHTFETLVFNWCFRKKLFSNFSTHHYSSNQLYTRTVLLSPYLGRQRRDDSSWRSEQKKGPKFVYGHTGNRRQSYNEVMIFKQYVHKTINSGPLSVGKKERFPSTLLQSTRYDYTTIFLSILFFSPSIVAVFTAHENIIDIVLIATLLYTWTCLNSATKIKILLFVSALFAWCHYSYQFAPQTPVTYTLAYYTIIYYNVKFWIWTKKKKKVKTHINHTLGVNYEVISLRFRFNDRSMQFEVFLREKKYVRIVDGSLNVLFFYVV